MYDFVSNEQFFARDERDIDRQAAELRAKNAAGCRRTEPTPAELATVLFHVQFFALLRSAQELAVTAASRFRDALQCYLRIHAELAALVPELPPAEAMRARTVALLDSLADHLGGLGELFAPLSNEKG